MTTDKVFILLLVILLPLTGCLDMTDNADAQTENPSSDPVDTPTMAETTPEIFSLHIAENANHTFDFDGNTTLKLETFYDNNNQNVAVSDYSLGYFNMTCNGVLLIENGMFRIGHYFPVLGGQNCSIDFIPMYDREVFMFLSEATLASL